MTSTGYGDIHGDSSSEMGEQKFLEAWNSQRFFTGETLNWKHFTTHMSTAKKLQQEYSVSEEMKWRSE